MAPGDADRRGRERGAPMKRIVIFTLLLLGICPLAQAAPDYPTKPIRILVPYGPGGATDIAARILAEQLKEKFHQPIVVENKPGGSGIVALQELVRAKPDGYTFLIGNITTNLLVPLIGEPPMPFDPMKDLLPVARLVDVPGVFLATKVNFPPNTVQEVVDYARAHPGEVNHSTAGILAYSHIDFLMLQKRTGIKLVAVPLRAGAGGGQIDLLNGSVQIAMQNAATVTPLVKAGKLKAPAVTSARRLAILPDVPTMKEAGFEGIGTNAWQAMFASRKVPRDVLDVFAAALTEALTDQKIVRQFEDLQFGVIPSHSIQEADDWLRNEAAIWKPIVADAKAMVKSAQ
jgi:tripartite-type tricarboxylate transporter receptor subunit TctC